MRGTARVLVEVCVDHPAGAAAAESAGADRIELCADLARGGVTPSIGTVRTTLAVLQQIAIQVLIRPRPGDFCYDGTEVAVMVSDIEAIAGLFAMVPVGFVIGALNPDGTVDRPVVQRLVEACGDASITFHKAFDLCRDLPTSLDVLADLGIHRVLTSGGAPTALAGAAALRDLVTRSAGRLSILAGGSVRPGTAAELVAATGVGEVHLRAPRPMADRMTFRRNGIGLGPGAKAHDDRDGTDPETVRAIVAELSAMG